MLTSNLTTYNLPLQIPKLELELKKHTAMVKISKFETHGSAFSVQRSTSTRQLHDDRTYYDDFRCDISNFFD